MTDSEIKQYLDNHNWSVDAQDCVLEVFNTSHQILDKIYDAHRQDAIDAKAGSILAGMKNDIEPYIENKDDEKIRHSLLCIISYSQNRIKELHPEHVLCKCAPETILDNWEQLKEFI